MYLQLADGQPASVAMPNLLKYMLRVPDGQGNMVWVREDQFYHLPDDVLMSILETQPHLNTMSGVFDGVKNAIQGIRQRRDQKQAAKNEVKLAKADAIRSGTYTSPLNQVVGAVKDVFAPGAAPADQMPMDTRSFPWVTGEASVGVNKWYQNPLTLGAIAVVGIGVVYFLTHPGRHTNR